MKFLPTGMRRRIVFGVMLFAILVTALGGGLLFVAATGGGLSVQVLVAAAVGVPVLGAIFGVLIAQSALQPLNDVVRILERLSQGDTALRIDVESDDEIGQLMQATQDMAAYLQGSVEVARHIARQDLHVEIRPKSERDLLHKAFQQITVTLDAMLKNIERSIEIATQQNWHKEGLNQLAREMAGETELKALCRKALSFLAGYVNAAHGVLYVCHTEQELLTLQGTFACTDSDVPAEEYLIGEGIIGQVARDREAIFLTEVPPPKRIETGTICERPFNTYAFPLLYNDELYGVIELAAGDAFSRRHQDFLLEANQSVATALFSVGRQERFQSQG